MTPRRLAGLALLVLAFSCSDSTGPLRQRVELNAARQRWRSQNLHAYAFTVQRSCFCLTVDPLDVLVLGDTVAGVRDVVTGESVDRRLGTTVDDLFTFIQDAIDGSAHVIRAEYDPAMGFPTEIDYDGEAQIADDEVSYRVSGVHSVPPSTSLGARKGIR